MTDAVTPEMNSQVYSLDRAVNPAAHATINLLRIISTSEEPLAVEQVFEQRNGGIYPTRTMEEVELLEQMGLIESDDHSRLVASHLGKMELRLQGVRNPQEVRGGLDRALQKSEAKFTDLPPEKYGNEEFRFTWASVHDLVEGIIEDNSYIKPRILALGAPTVAYFASQCGNMLQCHLLDVNDDVIDDVNNLGDESKVTAARYDAREPIPPNLAGRFDAVVFDPPWHNEFYNVFADRAYDMLRPFGRIYVSTFAPATRPEATDELNNMYSSLIGGGFSLIKISPEFFGYQIPPFEANVFAEQGITIRSRGKYGQLVVAEKIPDRTNTCSTPESIAKTMEEVTLTISGTDKDRDLGDLYLRADEEISGQGLITIEAFNGRSTYLTTSRSQRREENVNFITREHVAFHIANPKLFAEIAKNIVNLQTTVEAKPQLAAKFGIDLRVIDENIELVAAFLEDPYNLLQEELEKQ